MKRTPGNENPEQKREGRQNLIKARAALDAGEYISLLRKTAPDSLRPDEEGLFSVNAIEGEQIISDACNALGLNSDEIKLYLICLGEAVKERLKI